MRFFSERISHPALTNVEIDRQGLPATDVYPERMPDLFVGRPVEITGKYRDELRDVVVRGSAGGNGLAMPITAEQTQQ